MKKTVSTIITALALVLVPTVFAVGCGEGGSDETETFTVTVVGGTLSDGSTSGEFEEGTSVTVKATVPDGQTFLNWTEGQTILSSSAEYTFEVEYSITLTANFSSGQTTDEGLWVIEAEAMNLDDFHGVGMSGGGNQDGAIQGAGDAGLSQAALASLNKTDSDGESYNDGYFVGFFNGDGTRFTFTFESTEAVSDATLILRLGSEHGDMMFDPDILTIKVNGVELDYEPFTVTGEENSYGAFADYEISTKISLLANEVTGHSDLKDSAGNVVIERTDRVQNTVEIILHTNEYWVGGNNTTGGPGIDCIKIDAEGTTITYPTMGAEDEPVEKDYWLGGWPEDFEELNGEVSIIYRRGYAEKHGG